MAGVSKGRKSFSLQQMGTGDGGWTPGSLALPSNWDTELGSSNFTIYSEQELDLRAYNQAARGFVALRKPTLPRMSSASMSCPRLN